MKQLLFTALAFAIVGLSQLHAQTPGASPGQTPSSSRGAVLSQSPAEPVSIANDSAAQAPGNKLDVAPGTGTSGSPTGPEGQPAETIRKPD